MKNIRLIGLDADDTLWHNETIFEKVQARYREILAQYHDAAAVDRTLFATETRNLEAYGYGVKGFTLSAIETAIELTEGKISAREIKMLLDIGRDMLAHPVDLLEGVAETVASLSKSHTLMVVTKGDLVDQQRKLKKSGIADYFAEVEIVSEKDSLTYVGILRRHATKAEEFLMVGNSPKSDILPVLEIGGSAAYVPYAITWAHENTAHLPDPSERYVQLASLRELPDLLG